MFLLLKFTAFLLKITQYSISKCCFVVAGGIERDITCFSLKMFNVDFKDPGNNREKKKLKIGQKDKSKGN